MIARGQAWKKKRNACVQEARLEQKKAEKKIRCAAKILLEMKVTFLAVSNIACL